MRRICAIAIIVFIVIALIFLGYALLKGEAREPNLLNSFDLDPVGRGFDPFKIDWPTDDLVATIPDPSDVIYIPDDYYLRGRIIQWRDNHFECDIFLYSSADAVEYMSACIDAGFTIDMDTYSQYNGETCWEGWNSDGLFVRVCWHYDDNYMNINIIKDLIKVTW